MSVYWLFIAYVIVLVALMTVWAVVPVIVELLRRGDQS